jgi:Terminase large subunit, T4likevirus-type, N-terminal
MADAGDGLPLIELFRALPMDFRRRVLRRHGEEQLLDWLRGAGSLRAAQSPPDGDWGIWVILAGRGFGKTHAGAEWVHARAAGTRPRRFALVAPTLDVARAVMVEGESGLLARLPPGEQLTWQPSAKRLLWGNGSEARLYSGAEPNSLRGGQFDYAWGDEFAHWPGGEETVMNLRMATRLGAAPQILLTTTPLPLAWLKALIAEAGVVVTRGHTADNEANLPRTYLARMERRFGGTATGRQELARVGTAGALLQPSDPGRALVHGYQAAGPTTLLALDLPPLPGELPDGPRLWIAGAGASAGWRRAGVMLSLDDGASYEPVGLLPAPVAMGRAVSVLPAAIPVGWDRLGQVEVELIADSMWLESRSEQAVLAGANLALLGDEIIQFATAEALGSRSFRLSGLLRARRGTDLAVATHAVDERFVLLDQGAMLAVPLPLERQGQTVLLRANGAGDAAAVPVAATLDGAGIRPLLPVHLSWRRQAGQLHLSWIAQSRAGFGWPDLADVPIGESRLAFRAVLRDAAGIVAEAELNEPSWILADQAGPLWLDVAQVGATMGPVATFPVS